MDASTVVESDFISVFRSWSYSPDACLLQLASLHVKDFWNPTFGKHAWILQDYIEYNHIFIQLEMLLKERVRCILRLNVGISDLKETLAVQNSFIDELVQLLVCHEEPLKEARLMNMWKDMEEFANKGIAAEQRLKPTLKPEPNRSLLNTEKIDEEKSLMKKPKLVENLYNEDVKQEKIVSELASTRKLPLHWKNSQTKLLNLEKKLNGLLKSSTFRFLRQVSKDKNKLIINFSTSQNLLENCQQNYNDFSAVRIHQAFEKLIIGLINYKYKRKRKMSEDAKDSSFVNVLDNLVEDNENRFDKIEKENKRLSMINQIDMALKYNNVLKVKQLMSEDDFLLLSEEDKNKIDLKVRLATLEVYEIKLLMEKEEMDKLKLSLEKEKEEKNKAAINK
jgi:hypothetical protein